MDLFKLEPGLAIWTWVAFGVLFFILSRYVFPPLLKSIRAREETIARSVDNASRIERRLAEIESERVEMVKRSRAEADELLRKTRAEAEVVRKKLLEKAEQEAQGILERVHKEVAEEREIAMEEIRREVAGLVMGASEKIVGESFSAEADRKWTEKLADTL